MRALVWNETGRRFFEVGVDRGVLYPEMGIGVSWNGLVSVDEAPSGGEPSSYYFDGNKYLDFVANEDFQATITAYTYPVEFEALDGNVRLAPGLYATFQRRKTFGLCYRSMVGNDTEGPNYAYKLHIVWNATVQPSGKTRQARTDAVDPMTFSWGVSAVPPVASTYKPTAHFVIDSREISALKLQTLEEILYGQSIADVTIDGGSASYTSFGTIDGGSAGFTSPGVIDGYDPFGVILPRIPTQAEVISILS